MMTNGQPIVCTRERLREIVEGQGRGKAFENAHSRIPPKEPSNALTIPIIETTQK
jgi:hypothetical protein